MSRTTLDDVLECVICLDDVENAHLCPLCSKVACLQCWELVIPRYCPNCRGDLTELKLIKCYWISDLGNCVKELKLASEQEKTKKAELENELVNVRAQLKNAPGPSGDKPKPKPKGKKKLPENVSESNNSDRTVPLPSAAPRTSIPPLMGLQRTKKLKSKLGSLHFKPEIEVISAVEPVSWLKGSEACYDSKDIYGWGNVGRYDANLAAEAYWFCKEEILENLAIAKVVFEELDGMELVKVRFRANPFEKVKGVFSINRSAMKMANLDAVFRFMFTKPSDMDGNLLMDDSELLFCADLCGGPGGFSEYILWRKKWRAKVFGITLKGENDYKLDKFLEAPSDSFEPFYGPKNNGDICDPENIDSFCEHVMRATEDGVHFTVADGGDSDEGQDNMQEIKLKRLFLCQCLVALRILRYGGHFVVKFFDLLTPFCVGLVYLMHTCFERIAIHKPNTCLPANSERYLVCEYKRVESDCIAVIDYLTRINHRLIELEGTESDIINLVPTKLITIEGSEFVTYITDSNNFLGNRQLTALLKIAAFSEDPFLVDTRQNQIKIECLQLYEIKEKPRTAPIQIDPATIITDILGTSADKLRIKTLAPGSLSALKNVYNVKYCFLRRKRGELVSQPTLFYGQGGSKVLRLDDQNQWVQLPVILGIKLPRDTLIYGLLMSEFGEPDFNEKVVALYIIDAARLAGEDIMTKNLETRKKLCGIFAKAIKQTGNFVYHKMFYPLLDLENAFTKLCNYNNFLGHAFSQLDDGVLLIPCCKHPWIQSSPFARYHNLVTGACHHSIPNEGVCDFTYVLENMLIWRWNDSELQPKQLFDVLKVK